MKRKDVQVLLLAAFIATIFSILLSNVIFGSPKKHPIKVPVVSKISQNFPSPQNDDAYKAFFNKDALNPTQLIQIGGNSNTTPFNNNQ